MQQPAGARLACLFLANVPEGIRRICLCVCCFHALLMTIFKAGPHCSGDYVLDVWTQRPHSNVAAKGRVAAWHPGSFCHDPTPCALVPFPSAARPLASQHARPWALPHPTSFSGGGPLKSRLRFHAACGQPWLHSATASPARPPAAANSPAWWPAASPAGRPVWCRPGRLLQAFEWAASNGTRAVSFACFPTYALVPNFDRTKYTRMCHGMFLLCHMHTISSGPRQEGGATRGFFAAPVDTSGPPFLFR